MHRYALRDDQWDKIKDFLPGREGHVGGTAADNRLFVDAVIYRYRTGIPWRDLPERYGHWKAVHRRYRRWCKSGVFMRVFEIMARDADNEFVRLDANRRRGSQRRSRAQGQPLIPSSLTVSFRAFSALLPARMLAPGGFRDARLCNSFALALLK
jgi:transposase